MIKEPIFLIGPGYRTDFAINRARLGHDIVILMKESIRGAVEAAEIDPTDIDHIAAGNFAVEGSELMKPFATDETGDFLGAVAWYELNALYPDGNPMRVSSPQLFRELMNEYVKRFSHWSLWRDKGSSEAFTSFAPG